jgi:hypothetical protein
MPRQTDEANPWEDLAEFLGELTPADAPFEFTIGYGPRVNAPSGSFVSVDGRPFWYAIGRFGKFGNTDADPGVSLTSAADAVGYAVSEATFDLLVVQGFVAVEARHIEPAPSGQGEDESAK